MRSIELQSIPQLLFALPVEFGTEMQTNCALVSLCTYIWLYHVHNISCLKCVGFFFILIDVVLISEIKCPLEIPFGRLSSVCRGLVGEICALNCDDETMESVHVFCSSMGFWDKDISTICTARSQFPKYYLHTDIITFATISIEESCFFFIMCGLKKPWIKIKY